MVGFDLTFLRWKPREELAISFGQVAKALRAMHRWKYHILANVWLLERLLEWSIAALSITSSGFCLSNLWSITCWLLFLSSKPSPPLQTTWSGYKTNRLEDQESTWSVWQRRARGCSINWAVHTYVNLCLIDEIQLINPYDRPLVHPPVHTNFANLSHSPFSSAAVFSTPLTEKKSSRFSLRDSSRLMERSELTSSSPLDSRVRLARLPC